MNFRRVLVSTIVLSTLTFAPRIAEASPVMDSRSVALNTSGWPETQTGYGSCPSAYVAIDLVGIDFTTSSGYSTWHTRPSNSARYGDALDFVTSAELYGCTPWWFTSVVTVYTFRYLSWQGLVDQFDCHDAAPLGLGTGPTWDLEGFRHGTRNLWTWASSKCNW